MQVHVQVCYQNIKRDHVLRCMQVHVCKLMFKQVTDLTRPVCWDFLNALLQFSDGFVIEDESLYIEVSIYMAVSIFVTPKLGSFGDYTPHIGCKLSWVSHSAN